MIPGHHDVELVSGAYLNLLDPDPGVITLDVIAHGLSNTCRFGGQTKRFYSVAEHACVVAQRLRSDGCSAAVQLAGLHHDDAEAFIADIARPLKSLLQPAYGDVSSRLDRAVSIALGIPLLGEDLKTTELVKRADDWALSAEAFHLLMSRGSGWWSEGIYIERNDTLQMWRIGEPPDVARKMFMLMHQQLVTERDLLLAAT